MRDFSTKHIEEIMKKGGGSGSGGTGLSPNAIGYIDPSDHPDFTVSYDSSSHTTTFTGPESRYFFSLWFPTTVPSYEVVIKVDDKIIYDFYFTLSGANDRQKRIQVFIPLPTDTFTIEVNSPSGDTQIYFTDPDLTPDSPSKCYIRSVWSV